MRYEVITIAVLCGAFAHVFINILVQPGFPLAWWAKLNYWFNDKSADWGVIFKPSIITRAVWWLQKPLLTCSYCCAGQAGLWVYLLTYWGSYNLAEHATAITGAIALADVLGSVTGRKIMQQKPLKQAKIPPEVAALTKQQSNGTPPQDT